MIRHYAISAAIALTIGVVGFAAGRFTVPTKVEIRTEYLERVREVRSTQIARVIDTKWKRIVVTQPDGSSTVTETSDTHETSQSTENTEVAKTIETKNDAKTVYARQNLSLTVFGAVDLSTLQNPTGKSTLRIGVDVGYRVLGPVSAHVFYLSPSILGAGVGVSF